jgi:hypothetical protein
MRSRVVEESVGRRQPVKAISEAAQRERRRGGLAAEARRLMQDESYAAEAREIARLMEQLRGSG